MRTQLILPAAALLAAGALLGWLTASGRIDAPLAIGQEKAKKEGPAEKQRGGTARSPTSSSS
jgi:hypothetical protein